MLFDWSSGSIKLIIPYPVFKTSFGVTDKRSFLIRGQEIGEIVPFPVWIIPFPVFKSSFKLVDKI